MCQMDARLAKADEGEASREGAQTLLAQLAERCRVGVDADVARGLQRTTATGSLPAGDEWASAWAAPLGALLQVSHLKLWLLASRCLSAGRCKTSLVHGMVLPGAVD